MEVDDEVNISPTAHSEQVKLLEQKISRLEKLVKSRDEALNEMYELEKSKNDEIAQLKERIKQDGLDITKLQKYIETLNDETEVLNDKLSKLEQQNVNNIKQKQNNTSLPSTPQMVENLLTDKESLYKEIADLRLKISQLEGNNVEKENEISLLSSKITSLESEKNYLIEQNKNCEENNNSIIQHDRVKISEYESKIKTLSNEVDLLKYDCLDLIRVISILYSNFNKISGESSESDQELYPNAETLNTVADYIKFSDVTTDLVKAELESSKYNSNISVNNYSRLISFTRVIKDRIIENHTNNYKITENEGMSNYEVISVFENSIKYYLNQSCLTSISHSSTLAIEKDLISNRVSFEYNYIMKFIDILITDYEKRHNTHELDSTYGLFETFSDYYYHTIVDHVPLVNNSINFEVKTIDRSSSEYILAKKLLYCSIKSVVENNFEYIIAQINDLFSTINNEIAEPIKLDIQSETKSDNFDCNDGEESIDNVEFSVKNYSLSLFKLNLGFGWTIIHLLSYSEKIDIIQLFIEHLDFEEKLYIVNNISNSGFTPLTFSVLNDNLLLTELFLACGSDAQAQDSRRNTLVHLTSNPEIQETLIKRRAKLSVKNSSGQLPIIVNDEQLRKYNVDDCYGDYTFDNDNVADRPNISTDKEHTHISGTLKNSRSLSCQVFESDNTDDRVVLSAWIGGTEPNSSCRDDFCVFSTPEFENSYNNSTESSIWSILGFKQNNKNMSNIYKGKNSDYAAMEDNYDRLEEMCLTLNERKKGIWSDIIINYTARGLEKSCFPPPLDCPTSLFRQILVLTSERFALFQYSPLKLLQSSPITEVEEIIVPKNSNVLLILKVDGWDDILFEINRRSEFLREFTTNYRTLTTPSEILLSHVISEKDDGINVSIENKIDKSNSFWFGFMGSSNVSNNISNSLSPARESAFQNIIAAYGETPSIKTEPDNLIGLFDSENQYSIILAIINKTSFMLLPHRSASLLVSMPTYHFGFLGICINPPLALENPLSLNSNDSSNSHKDNANENRLWQERFFILRSDGFLIWCHHPNDEIPCESIPIRLVRQIRVFNLATNTENEIIPCFALDFTKNSLPSSLVLNSETSEMRDKWVEKIHNVRTIISELCES